MTDYSNLPAIRCGFGALGPIARNPHKILNIDSGCALDQEPLMIVIWAMCTRCDPRDQVDIIHGGWSSALDPMCYDAETDRRNSRVVIDACIPFNRKKTFPVVARLSKELDARIRAKLAHELPKGL